MFRLLFTDIALRAVDCPGRAVRRAVARAASLAAVTLLSLGTLSGTAQAQYTYYLRVPCSIRPEYRSGGDADVTSKSGRYTDVVVRTSEPQLLDPFEGRIFVTYEVTEVAPNHTVLRRTEVVPFYAPPGCKMRSAGYNRPPVNFGRRYRGEDHEWHDESAAVAGTYMEYLEFKFDGPGRDDLGNAAMFATLVIPVEVVAD
jgi:hypothetical protein